jgi:hypothetical protein
MLKSILILVTASILSTLALGCASTTLPSVAFEPRAYPFVPGEIGLDGPPYSGLANPAPVGTRE